MAKKTTPANKTRKSNRPGVEPVATIPSPPVKSGRGKRVCPGCSKIVASAAKSCPECGTPRPEKPEGKKTGAKRRPVLAVVESGHDATVSLLELLKAANSLGGIDSAIELLQTIKAAR